MIPAMSSVTSCSSPRGGKADAGWQFDRSFVGQSAGNGCERGLSLLDLPDAQRAGGFQALAQDGGVAGGNSAQNPCDQPRLSARQGEQCNVRLRGGKDGAKRRIAQMDHVA